MFIVQNVCANDAYSSLLFRFDITAGKEVNPMREVKNADGRLVAKLDEQSKTVVIQIKGCVTKISFKPDGSCEILNSKPAV